MPNNLRHCSTCGYPLDEAERRSLIEVNGKMYKKDIVEDFRNLIHEVATDYEYGLGAPQQSARIMINLILEKLDDPHRISPTDKSTSTS